MSERTGIAWTDHTFNPWWGCVKVSPGCANCYAEGEAHRRGFDVWGPKADRRGFSAAHWKEPERWNRAAEKEGRRHRVFCASMADVFEDLDPPRDGGDLRSYDMEARRFQLWDLIARTPWLDWQLLTKRPENIRRFLPKVWLERPMPNVWLGTSAEDQERADERIPILLQTPAAVRFVSAEPLLGPVNLRGLIMRPEEAARCACGHGHGFTRCPNYGSVAPTCHWHGCPCPGFRRPNGITMDWVIVGGESGPRARPCRTEWVRAIVSQCLDAAVPVFVKQLGAVVEWGRVGACGFPLGQIKSGAIRFEAHGGGGADGYDRIYLRDRKGADPTEWPEDLRVQEFPA